jgi:transaldolase
MEKTLGAIVEASPDVVLVQVIGWNDPEPLIRQARWLHSFSDRIIVKLPASIAGTQALQQLKRELPDLRLAVTAIASIAQAYVTGRVGADIAAIFNGPLDQAEDVAHDMIGPVRRIYENYGFETKILACGRYPRLFGEVAAAGADICTMRMPFMRLLYQHPFTDQRMHGFLGDWRATFGERTWPELS